MVYFSNVTDIMLVKQQGFQVLEKMCEHACQNSHPLYYFDYMFWYINIRKFPYIITVLNYGKNTESGEWSRWSNAMICFLTKKERIVSALCTSALLLWRRLLFSQISGNFYVQHLVVLSLHLSNNVGHCLLLFSKFQSEQCPCYRKNKLVRFWSLIMAFALFWSWCIFCFSLHASTFCFWVAKVHLQQFDENIHLRRISR